MDGKVFWLSALNLKDVPYKIDSPETLDRAHVKYVLSKSKICVQNRCQLGPKGGLNLAKRWLFISVIQGANGIVNHWDKPDDNCAQGKKMKLV